MKDLGEAETILGIKIYRDRSHRLLGLSQEKYINKVLNRFYMANSKKGNIPSSQGVVFPSSDSPTMKEDREFMSKVPYALAIRSIM